MVLLPTALARLELGIVLFNLLEGFVNWGNLR